MRIFISFAHDDLPIIRQLAEFLRNGGLDVWYDQRLVGGKPWKEQLLAQIKAADCFFYALTPKSVASAWCQWEFAQAVHAGKPIITVLLERTTLSGVLAEHHYVDFRNSTPEAAFQLSTAIYEAEPVPPERVKLISAPDSEPERPTDPSHGGETVVNRFFDDAYDAYRSKDYDGAHELVLLCLELAPGYQAALALLRQLDRRMNSRIQHTKPAAEIATPFQASLPPNIDLFSAQDSEPERPTDLEHGIEQKTVFISYRRDKSKHLARAIYHDLNANGWDVFLDVNTIDSGDFDRIILNQIEARAHFILLISPGSLDRCANPGELVLREIEEAVRLERNIIPIIEEGADFAHEMSHLPDSLRATVSKKNGLPLHHFFFEPAMDVLRTRFLKTPQYVRVHEAPAADRAEVQRRIAAVKAPAPAFLRSLALLPAPFAWIDIPGKSYGIAKYPVTNAQFAKFIEAGGYYEPTWWTDEGWKAREEGWVGDNGWWEPSGKPWTEPRYWNDTEWNGAEQPVVGVSWYEAVAFCLWLSASTGEKITLPTEDQWQYAAQGDDGRMYPWGNEWDYNRCNNSVMPANSKATMPVTRYEGEGDSYFGVVDMAGNVREWCLTDSEIQTNDGYGNPDECVLHGGSWSDHNPGDFYCAVGIISYPYYRNQFSGFRLARS